MKLSVIIPVYNEVQNIEEILKRVKATALRGKLSSWMMIPATGPAPCFKKLDGKDGVRVVLHDRNQGKGAAVRTGLQEARGEILLIQDADLEYSPHDYPVLLQPIEEGIADVVYGSRFLGGPRRATMFWHMIANQLLTFMTNILYDNILSDMETGYKVFRREVVDGMKLRSNRFNFEPEFTAKVLKRHYRIYEVPISFNPAIIRRKKDPVSRCPRRRLDTIEIQVCGLILLNSTGGGFVTSASSFCFTLGY